MRRTLMTLALGLATLLGACLGQAPDPCASVSGTPSLEVAIGAGAEGSSLESITTSGQPAPLYLGTQRGLHIYLRLIARNICPVRATLERRGYRVSDDELLIFQRSPRDLAADAETWVSEPLRMPLCPGGRILEPLRLQVSLLDTAGRMATDDRTVTPSCAHLSPADRDTCMTTCSAP